MGIRVNTNILSLNAQRNLGKTAKNFARALQRLSSGSRINRAGDDPAGLSISEGLVSQIRGTAQCVRNSNDAIGFLNTAEGGLAEIANMTQRLRELAIQSSNGTLGVNDRTALNNEAQQLLQEFQRIATQTQFNGTNLIDGSFSTTNLQVGVSKGMTIAFTIGNAQATALGALATISGVRGQIQSALAGVDINGVALSNSIAADDTLSFSGNSYSAIAIAYVVNQQTSSTKVYADVDTTIVQGNNMSFSNYQGSLALDSFTINNIGITGTGINTVNSFIAAVNNFSNQTGVQARLQQNATSSIELFANDGRNINISWAAPTASTYMYGAWDYLGSTNSTTTGGITGISAALIFSAATSTALFSSGATNLVRTGSVHLRSSSAVSITNMQTAALGFTNTSLSVDPTQSVNFIILTDQNNAASALAVLDATLQQISSLRSGIGATQSRLDSTINSLGVTLENVSGANSQIRDADIANETAELTKAQVLQQAGVAVLGQANSSVDLALSLLKSL
jgi:flagellin